MSVREMSYHIGNDPWSNDLMMHHDERRMKKTTDETRESEMIGAPGSTNGQMCSLAPRNPPRQVD